MYASRMWEFGLKIATHFVMYCQLYFVICLCIALGIFIKIKHIMKALVTIITHRKGMGCDAASIFLIKNTVLSLLCALFHFLLKKR